MHQPTISEELARQLVDGKSRKPVTSTSEQRSGSHIVDITEESIGTAIIITGARLLSK